MDKKNIKITIIGNSVGKSTLLIRYLKNNNLRESDIDDKYIIESNINIEGQDYKLELMDTTSIEDYLGMLEMFVSFADGIILIFAINDKESFEILKKVYERIIKAKKDAKYPMILVGNMKDLENYRQIAIDEAKALAELWGIEYLEISVKTNFRVNEVFEKLAQDIVKYKYPKPKKRARHCAII